MNPPRAGMGGMGGMGMGMMGGGMGGGMGGAWTVGNAQMMRGMMRRTSDGRRVRRPAAGRRAGGHGRRSREPPARRRGRIRRAEADSAAAADSAAPGGLDPNAPGGQGERRPGRGRPTALTPAAAADEDSPKDKRIRGLERPHLHAVRQGDEA